MPAVEVSSGGLNQTIPGAIHVINALLGPDWPSETPRYAWHWESEPKVVMHAYRVVASRMADEDEPREIALSSIGEARVRVMADDPWATDDAGVGYHFHCRPFSALTRLSFHCPEIEPRTLGRSYYVDLSSAAKFAEDFVLQGMALHVALAPLFVNFTKALEEVAGLRDEVSKLLAHVDKSNQATARAILPAVKAVAPVAQQETHVGAVRWLEEHVGLSQDAIGDLIGVTRQAIHNWLHKGAAIRDENRQRLLAVRDILERVLQQHHNSEAVKTWLDTPRGPDAKTPRQLLMANEVGKARALSLSTAIPRSRSAPAWLSQSPPDPWTRRQQRRRERIVRAEPAPDPDADGGSDGSDRD